MQNNCACAVEERGSHAARTLRRTVLGVTWNALMVCNELQAGIGRSNIQYFNIGIVIVGICMVEPGPCDQIGKGCCNNSVTGVNYCSSEVEPLTCNTITKGDDPATCETCGGANEPCCFPSWLDASTAAPRDLATAYPACRSDEMACMLDAGSADFYGQCGIRSSRDQLLRSHRERICSWTYSL